MVNVPSSLTRPPPPPNIIIPPVPLDSARSMTNAPAIGLPEESTAVPLTFTVRTGSREKVTPGTSAPTPTATRSAWEALGVPG